MESPAKFETRQGLSGCVSSSIAAGRYGGDQRQVMKHDVMKTPLTAQRSLKERRGR
jgi:hypothetical protein